MWFEDFHKTKGGCKMNWAKDMIDTFGSILIEPKEKKKKKPKYIIVRVN